MNSDLWVKTGSMKFMSTYYFLWVLIWTYYGALRMEKLDLRVQSSLAKSIGTMVSIAGALTVTLYKGPALVSMSSSSNLHNELRSPQKNWIIGGLVLAASSFFLSLLYIVQVTFDKTPKIPTYSLIDFWDFYLPYISSGKELFLHG